MKLTPAVNFINVLRANYTYKSAFVHLPNPKCNSKKLCQALWYTKAAHKTLMKLTPGVNFINILQSTIVLADSKIGKNAVKF